MAVLSEESEFALDFGSVSLCAVTQVAQRPDHLGDAVPVVAQDFAVLLEPVRRHRMIRGHAKMLAGMERAMALILGGHLVSRRDLAS